MKFSLLPLGVFFLLAVSCSVDQEIFLNGDGSGKVAGRVTLDDFYLSTLQDLTALSSPAAGEEGPMDPDYIAAELRRNPHLTKIQVIRPAPGRYSGTMAFQNIRELFYTEEGVPGTVVSFTRNGNARTLAFRINRENFQELFRFFPALQDPGFQYFLPEAAIGREEYMEMLLFLFEDQYDRGSEELRKRLEEASLNLTIRTSGRILSHQGGEKRGDREYTLRIPLLDLMLHQQELRYGVTFE